MSRLAEANSAINLGQGFPDETGPREILEKAADAIFSPATINIRRWRARPPCAKRSPRMRSAIGNCHANGMRKSSSPPVRPRRSPPAILAFVSPGDEVIIFEPSYDAYVPLIRRAGGVAGCRFGSKRLIGILSEKALRAALRPGRKR